MDSRRFIVGFLAAQLVLLAALVGLITWGQMLFMSAEYPMWKAKEKMLATVDERSLVLLGDSRAMAAFVPEDIAPEFVNLALGGTTPIEAYYQLRHILARTTPRLVVLSYGPYHYELADAIWERAAKFDKVWLGAPEMEEILGVADRLGDTRTVGSFLGEPPNRLPLALRYNLPTAFKGDLIPPPPPWRYFDNRRMLDSTLAARGHHLFGTAAHAFGRPDEVTGQRFAASPLIEHYLRRVLEECGSRGIPVLLVTPPMPEQDRDLLDKAGYVRSFHAWLHGLGLDLDPALAGLRFEDDARFGDSSHFNAQGAAEFSARLKARITEAARGGRPSGPPDRSVTAGGPRS